MEEKEKKADEKAEMKAEVKAKKILLSPEHFTSRQLAHDIEVAKFLAGGKF